MGLDWDRVVGEGGAYLVERAAAVQQNGRLSPTALRLVVEEAQRLKFILSEELARLKPEGDLTEGAIAVLRSHYHTRLDAAARVIAAAHQLATPHPVLSPQGVKEISAPAPTAPASGGGDTVPQGGKGTSPGGGVREGRVARSI